MTMTRRTRTRSDAKQRIRARLARHLPDTENVTDTEDRRHEDDKSAQTRHAKHTQNNSHANIPTNKQTHTNISHGVI